MKQFCSKMDYFHTNIGALASRGGWVEEGGHVQESGGYGFDASYYARRVGTWNHVF